MAKGNTLTVGFKETKDVLLLVIGLGRMYEQVMADKKVNFADIQHLLPVLFLIGPALDNFENVQLELKMATKEEGDELKQWVNEQLDLGDKSVEEFVEAAFAVVLDIWMVFRTFFFPGEENKFKVSQETPKDEGPFGTVIPEDPGTGEEVKVESASSETSAK